jgi:hypothetical protein
VIIKASKYNDISTSYQLAFSFSDPHSITTNQLSLLSHIMIDLMHKRVDTKANVNVIDSGALILFSISYYTDIPKLVNWLKTHSAKRFNAENIEIKASLWQRGYVLKSVGEPLNMNDCFKLLSNKR